jgi:hypothetical protein
LKEKEKHMHIRTSGKQLDRGTIRKLAKARWLRRGYTFEQADALAANEEKMGAAPEGLPGFADLEGAEQVGVITRAEAKQKQGDKRPLVEIVEEEIAAVFAKKEDLREQVVAARAATQAAKTEQHRAAAKAEALDERNRKIVAYRQELMRAGKDYGLAHHLAFARVRAEESVGRISVASAAPAPASAPIAFTYSGAMHGANVPRAPAASTSIPGAEATHEQFAAAINASPYLTARQKAGLIKMRSPEGLAALGRTMQLAREARARGAFTTPARAGGAR